ncbi:hypothetical protein AB1K91_17910 [Terribacillus sp. 179-K 1B1 HS]|uniref:hypothetical protein n=1 Tax=Terribacillus sp. 179-K 1B1 HS TaxID=3142388 RepID=UPI0039A19CF0
MSKSSEARILFENIYELIGRYNKALDESGHSPEYAPKEVADQILSFCETRDVTHVSLMNHLDEGVEGYGKHTTFIIRLTDKGSDGE